MACRQRMRFPPQRTGRRGRIYTGGFPPLGLIAATMDLAMVPSAQRDSELVADLAAERAALSKAQMMRIRRLPTANQAGLLGHESDVMSVTDRDAAPATSTRSCRWTLNRPASGLFSALRCSQAARCAAPGQVRPGDRCEARQLRLESFFDVLGIGCGEFVLFWKRSFRPKCGFIAV